MAKGQVRSNKEIRKPKKDKTKAAAAAPAGSQVKFANATTADGKRNRARSKPVADRRPQRNISWHTDLFWPHCPSI